MTLDDGVDTITLPDSLEWINEYDWSTVGQDKRETLGGGLVIQEADITAGRPIILQGGDNVWVDKLDVDALYALYSVADKTYTLTLADARTFTVMFDRSSGDAFVAKPVWRKNVHEDTDKFTLTLRLMEV